MSINVELLRASRIGEDGAPKLLCASHFGQEGATFCIVRFIAKSQSGPCQTMLKVAPVSSKRPRAPPGRHMGMMEISRGPWDSTGEERRTW